MYESVFQKVCTTTGLTREELSKLIYEFKSSGRGPKALAEHLVKIAASKGNTLVFYDLPPQETN